MCNMVFSSKKAMSPLIATVLLIAFAVALGAMIMNWSVGAEPDLTSDFAGCSKASLTSDDGVCLADNRLSFNLRNDGDVRIAQVQLVIHDEFGETITLLSDSALIKGESIDGVRPYVYDGGSIQLKFIPLINADNGELVACDAGSYTQDVLHSC